MYTNVINLASSETRRKAMTSSLSLAGVSFELIEAVDGRGINPTEFDSYDDRAAKLRHGRSLSGGEIGCYLSHIAALKRFVASGKPVGLILEDDIHFTADVQPKIMEILGCVDAKMASWDVINLTKADHSFARKLGHIDENEIFYSFYFPMLSGANLWSRHGARHFLSSKFAKRVRGPYDTELRSFCAQRRRGLCLKNPILLVRDEVSDIDSTMTLRSKKTRYRPILPRLLRHFPDRINASIGVVFGPSLRK